MSYLRRNSESVKDDIKSIKYAFYIFILLFVFGIILRAPLYNFFSYIGESFWSYENSVIKISRNFLNGMLYYSDVSEDLGNLKEENIRLKSELKDLHDRGVIVIRNGTSTATVSADIRLNKATNYSDDIRAGVLRNPPFSKYDYLLIDKGSSDGLKVGYEVYTDTGYALGKIFELSSHSANVRMYSSFGEKIQVKIGTSTIMTEAIGLNNGTYLISLPKGNKIKAGDTVHLPGLSNDLVGEISYVQDDASKVFQEILFRYPFSISGIDKVIVKSANE